MKKSIKYQFVNPLAASILASQTGDGIYNCYFIKDIVGHL
jgi:hypothetical protein